MVNDSLLNAVTGTNNDGPAATIAGRDKEVQYWRMCGDEYCTRHGGQGRNEGWISTGPVLQPFTAQEYAEFGEIKHAEPLEDYGRWNPDLFREPGQRFAKLIEGGGLKEMPDSQLLAYGWHHLPEVVADRPSLAPFLKSEFWCEHGCPTKGTQARWFIDQEQYNVHISSEHKEVIGPSAIGEQIKNAMEAVGNAQQMDMPTLVASIMLAIKEHESPSTVSDED